MSRETEIAFLRRPLEMKREEKWEFPAPHTTLDERRSTNGMEADDF